ncbi:hypothetical protein ACS0TY_001692 [Phlomoides rotata]
MELVMENNLQDNFVPNDTDLHADGQYCQIVTRLIWVERHAIYAKLLSYFS